MRCSPDRRIRAAVTAAVLAATVAGCTGGGGGADPTPDGTFVLPSETPVTCLEHQSEPPGPAYTGGADGDTAAIFRLLRYWTANGALAYCDGEPPSDVDQQWRDLVEQLGATRPPDPPGSTPAPTPSDAPTSSSPVPTST